jgi:hypothetical protein
MPSFDFGINAAWLTAAMTGQILLAWLKLLAPGLLTARQPGHQPHGGAEPKIVDRYLVHSEVAVHDRRSGWGRDQACDVGKAKKPFVRLRFLPGNIGTRDSRCPGQWLCHPRLPSCFSRQLACNDLHLPSSR